ncbi:hypothetical protein JQC72_03520 [Polycladomyces sp. WAk]|uniref:Uncharacterized protein n=1 Tax=Polycladomyces zharkentensis TaxID=2807616 RepID=A0ABS2WGB2_9BACL|nr:hypothetical protein [Polycladomyces sp. WAk]MBN2908587.1 hypothetical protein [Polycladomyces sp. WAk]
MARSYQQQWLDRIIDGTAKQGTAKLYRKNRKWFTALPITLKPTKAKKEALTSDSAESHDDHRKCL